MGSQTACDGGACTSGAVERRVRARLTCQPWGSSWKELPPLLASPLPLTGQGLELSPALMGASGSPACLSSVWRHSSGPLPHAGEHPSPRPWGSWTPDCPGPAQASPGCPSPRPRLSGLGPARGQDTALGGREGAGCVLGTPASPGHPLDAPTAPSAGSSLRAPPGVTQPAPCSQETFAALGREEGG